MLLILSILILKTGKDHCYILASTPLKQSQKIFLSLRRFKEEMFQDSIPLNCQLLTTQEKNLLKIVLSVLRSFLLFIWTWCYLLNWKSFTPSVKQRHQFSILCPLGKLCGIKQGKIVPHFAPNKFACNPYFRHLGLFF